MIQDDINVNYSPLWGVSTSHLSNKNDFSALLEYEPDLIEFYNYKDIKPIVDFCNKQSIAPALHVPTPYDGPELKRFCPTRSGTKEEIQLAIDLTKRTIQCAAEISAVHVVVHFPTPYAPYYPVTTEEMSFFLEPVSEYADRLDVNVLVENLTSHPFFHSPEQYLEITNQYKNLDFCLDVGHAHLLAPAFEVGDFINVWAQRINSVHLYNLTAARYKSHGHEIIEIEQQGDNLGWIDMKETLSSLLDIAKPRAIVLEYNPMEADEIRQSANKWKKFREDFKK